MIDVSAKGETWTVVHNTIGRKAPKRHFHDITKFDPLLFDLPVRTALTRVTRLIQYASFNWHLKQFPRECAVIDKFPFSSATVFCCLREQ
jgi:hypothetical protein